MDDYIIEYDEEYTRLINSKVREKYGPKHDRLAVHATDLIFCLRKAWGKRNVPVEEQDEISEDTILTWGEGLMFEDLVSTGEKQKQAAYCYSCRTVSMIQKSVHGDPEPIGCGECGKAWVVFTPDYIEDGIIHEAKQTRKSRRNVPEGAPWYIDQLRTYLLFAKRAGWTNEIVTRLIANCLMGDYGSKKKGHRPKPPQSTVDAYKIKFENTDWDAWERELKRRTKIVLSKDMPPLTGMAEDALSPQYLWECSSCSVGRQIGCERFVWDENDMEIGYEEKEEKEEDE